MFNPQQPNGSLASIFAGNSNNFSYQSPLPRLGAPMPPKYSGAMNTVAPKAGGKGKADVNGAMAAMKSASQDNNATRLSSAGEKSGVKFKHDNSGHATGQAAFDTLDAYMKKAGLNSFQANFFGRLISEGYGESEIRSAVKLASEKYGSAVTEELDTGLEKLAFGTVLSKLVPAAGSFARCISRSRISRFV